MAERAHATTDRSAVVAGRLVPTPEHEARDGIEADERSIETSDHLDRDGTTHTAEGEDDDSIVEMIDDWLGG